MKKVVAASLLSLSLACSVAVAQLKSKVDTPAPVSESLLKQGASDLWFGLFDPSKLTMRHSYSLMYTSFGGQGLSLGTYTNSLMYRFSDALDLQTDVSLMHSPFSTFGSKNDFSGIFLSRAQLNYRPTDNMWLQIQYRQVPPMYWLGGYRNPNYFYGIERYEDQR